LGKRIETLEVVYDFPMADRKTIARSTAASLRAFAQKAEPTPVVLGFDGFIDSIISVVETRYGVDRFDPIPTIGRLGEKITAAAGKSSNYELVVKQQKLGGNGPIMANAMARAGLKVDYIGALGDPSRGVHPIFEAFSKIATLHTIAAPAATDALEFSDGKLMLGKLEPLNDVNQQRIDETLGRAAYAKLLTDAKLLGMVNWSMCPMLGTIIEALASDVLPADAEKPVVFIDLTDPEKRTLADLQRVLEELRHLATMTRVYLGMNLKESGQVAEALGLVVDDEPELAIEATASMIREALGLRGAIVHPRRAAAGAVMNEQGVEERATFFGPFVEHPRLSTGAGDNFNAGFCLGLLAGMPLPQCLCCGTATSGFYVRNAQSPRLDELAAFCDGLPDPQ